MISALVALGRAAPARAAVVWLWVAVIAMGGATAFGQAAAGRIHLLLVGLTDDPSLGRYVEITLRQLEERFRTDVDAEYVASLRTLTGTECNAVTILDTIARLNVRPDDALFLYYSGHGAFDPARAAGDAAGGHFFAIPSGDLLRSELLDRMLQKRPRLAVLVSDACNVKATLRARQRPELKVTRETVRGHTPLEKLLLWHRGALDLNSTSPNECGWYDGSRGGWFSYVFARACYRHADWSSLLAEVARQSDSQYRELRGRILEAGAAGDETAAMLQRQPQMVPRVFRNTVQPLPGAPERPGVRQIERTIITWSAIF